MTRLQKLLGPVRKEDKILEIGASYNPAAPKSKGWKAKVLDHCSKEELIAKYLSLHLGTKYNALTFDLSAIEEVDYVWRGGSLESAVPKEDHGTFDVCIASHVIEHTTDIVGFIRSIETLLKPGGLIVLAVPDKRYCFDYFQALSSTGNVIDAMGASRHSRGKVFNSSAYGILQNQKATWGPGPLFNFELAQNLGDSFDSIRGYNAAPDGSYIDCHGWFFTPNSFQLIITELGQLGLINCHVYSSYPTTANEFFVTLKVGAPDVVPKEELNRQRLQLLISTQIDLLQQAYYNSEIRLPFGWRLHSYLFRFKEKLAQAAQGSWLAPVYDAYRHYYRDRGGDSAPGFASGSVLKRRYITFRDAVTYAIRRYHYRLTIHTRIGSWWRLRNSTLANAVPGRIIKPLSASPTHSVVFVTYHPQGFISDHVRNYVGNFKRAGYSVILVKVVDQMDHPLADSSIPDVDATMVRKNAGYDLGAWSHGLQMFPEVYRGQTLWIVNDSVFGPVTEAAFDQVLDRVEKSQADLVTLTESYQYNHHYQSYFLVFRNLAQNAEEVRKYWDGVRNVKGKRDVIFEYELDMMEHFSKLGFECRTLFSLMEISLAHNVTFFGWRQLLEAGFPFLKVPLLRPNVTEVDNSKCREVLEQFGYDSRLIDDHFAAMKRTF